MIANRRVLIAIVLVFVMCPLFSDTDVTRENFVNVPEETRPWAFWLWISGNISQAGITKDLEAAKANGISKMLIMEAHRDEVAPGPVTTLSEDWWSAMEHAAEEAARLDMEIGVFNCQGWSSSGGPWVEPDDAMRYVDWVEMKVTGGQEVNIDLNSEKEYFKTIAIVAFPKPEGDQGKHPIPAGAMVILNDALDVSAMHDGDVETAAVVPNESTIDIQFGEMKLLRSIAIYPWEHTFKCTLRLSKINDSSGQSVDVSTFEVDRRNYDLNVGFRPFAPVVIGFPETGGDHFQIEILESEGQVSIGEIELSEAHRISYFQEKQLAKMFPMPNPDGEAYLWDPSFEPTTQEVIIDPSSIVDLTGQLDDSGMLNWEAPEGSWIVVHFGMALTEVMNRPASDEGRGLEVDKFKKEAVARHFDAYAGELLNRFDETANNAVTHIVVDSYEVGSANWSENFPSAFNTRFGYDVLPFLPVFTGRVVGIAQSPGHAARGIAENR